MAFGFSLGFGENLALFDGDEQGVYFDPSVEGTLWQTTAMQVPCRPGDPVGMMLDRSQWEGKDPDSVYGPELLTNGTFDTGVEGWVLGTDWAYDAANKRVKRVGTTYHNLIPTALISNLVIGRQYIMSVERGGGPVGYYTETGSAKALLTGVQSIPFIYKGGNYPFFYTSSADGWIDNVSVREVVVADSLEPVLGPDLIVNGDFSQDVSGWRSIVSLVSWDNGGIKVVQNHESNSARISQMGAILAQGRSYMVSGTVRSLFNGAHGVRVKSGDQNLNIVSTFPYVSSNSFGEGSFETVLTIPRISDPDVLGYFGFGVEGGTTESGGGAVIDDVSVREISGNHALQYTASKRPIYGIRPRTGRKNLIPRSSPMGNSAYKTNGKSVIEGLVLGPYGEYDAVSVYVSEQFGNIEQSVVSIPTGSVTVSAWIRSGIGSDIPLYLGITTNGAYPRWSPITVTSEWKRYSVTVSHTDASETTVFSLQSRSGGTKRFEVYGTQIEEGSELSPYQRTISSYEAYEEGVDSAGYLSFDGVDDSMDVVIPDGASHGTAFIATEEGTGVYENTASTPGQFSIGPYIPGSTFVGMAASFEPLSSTQKVKTKGKFVSGGAGSDYSSAKDVSRYWRNMPTITAFPSFDLSSITHAAFTWYGCTYLTTFPGAILDGSYAKNFTGAFLGTDLSQESIDSILSAINANGVSGGTFDQSGGASPSLSGRTAISNLRGRGWATTHAINDAADMFHSGDSGVSFDPSVSGALWQGNEMGTPSIPGGTVAVMLDQSEWGGKKPGDILSPNIVVNGDPKGDLTGWGGPTGAPTWEDGGVRSYGAGQGNVMTSPPFAVTAGKSYVVTVVIKSLEPTGGQLGFRRDSIRSSWVSNNPTEAISSYYKTHRIVITATESVPDAVFTYRFNDVATVFIKSVSVQAIVSGGAEVILGEEKAKNSGFNSDSDWTHPYGDISDGQANVTNGYTFLTQDMGLTPGKSYFVTIEYVKNSGQRLRVNTQPGPGNEEQMATTMEASGTITGTITASTSLFNLEASGATFSGSIKYLSVKEILNVAGMEPVLGSERATNGGFDTDTSWTMVSGWSISGGKAVCDSTDTNQRNMSQGMSLELGRTYVIKVDVVVTAGALYLNAGGYESSARIGSTGTHTVMINISDTRSGGTFFLVARDGFKGTVDNVSVRELPGSHALQETGAKRPVYGVEPAVREGPNLLKNGNFVYGASGWTIRKKDILAVVNGRMRVTKGSGDSGANSGAYQKVDGLVTGQKYVLRIGGRFKGTNGAAGVQIEQSNYGPTAARLYGFADAADERIEFVASGPSMWVHMYGGYGATGTYVELENISLHRLYASQRNQLIRSEGLDSGWSTYGATIQGTRMYENDGTQIHRVYTGTFDDVDEPRSCSVRVMKSDARRIFVNCNALMGAAALFDISEGGGFVVNTSGVDFVSADIRDEGDHYLVSVSGNGGTVSGRVFLQMSPVTNNSAIDSSYVGDPSVYLEILSTQLEYGAAPTPIQQRVGTHESTEVHARRNMLKYTDDLSSSVWNKRFVSATSGLFDPFGGRKAFHVVPSSTAYDAAVIYTFNDIPLGDTPYTWSFYARCARGTRNVGIGLAGGVRAGDAAAHKDIIVTPEWQRFSITIVKVTGSPVQPHIGGWSRLVGGEDIEVAFPQFEKGLVASEYQSVVSGDDSEFDMPLAHYLDFDGVDDAMRFAMVNGMKEIVAGYRYTGVPVTLSTLINQGNGLDRSNIRLHSQTSRWNYDTSDSNDFTFPDGEFSVNRSGDATTVSGSPQVVRATCGEAAGKQLGGIGYSVSERYWFGRIYGIVATSYALSAPQKYDAEKVVAKMTGIQL